MYYYYITHNNYFGFCVAYYDNGTARIVFTGTIEECNAKCAELNRALWHVTRGGGPVWESPLGRQRPPFGAGLEIKKWR